MKNNNTKRKLRKSNYTLFNFDSFKKTSFKIFYILIIIVISIFTLLDAFVFPKKEKIINKSNEKVLTGKITSDEDSYYDDNISMQMKTINENNTKVYLIEVLIRKTNFLKTAFAEDAYGRNVNQELSKIAKNNGAVLAINGDNYGFKKIGFVLRNGEIYRDSVGKEGTDEDLVIKEDGSFEIIKESLSKLEEVRKNGAVHVLSAGPALINDGNISVSENYEIEEEKNNNSHVAIGMITPLDYIIAVSEGKTNESEGLSLNQLAKVMLSQNCKVAYNLNGGESTSLYFNGNVIYKGTKNKERGVTDIVYFGY